VAKAKFERTKPHVNHRHHRSHRPWEDDADRCHHEGSARQVSGPEPLHAVRPDRQGRREERERGITISIAHVEYQTEFAALRARRLPWPR